MEVSDRPAGGAVSEWERAERPALTQAAVIGCKLSRLHSNSDSCTGAVTETRRTTETQSSKNTSLENDLNVCVVCIGCV